MVLAAWLLVGLITMFGLSRLFAFGAGSDAHLRTPRARRRAVSRAERRPAGLWLATRAVVPGVLAGLFLLLIVEAALWPEQNQSNFRAAIVEPAPSGVMLPEVDTASTPSRNAQRRGRSTSRPRRRAATAATPSTATAARAGTLVTFRAPAPAATQPGATAPQRSRPQPRRPRPGAPRPRAKPVPGASPVAAPAPTATPAPVAVVADAPLPTPTPGPAEPSGAQQGKKPGKSGHAGGPPHGTPPGHAKARGKGHGKGRGKGHGPD